MTREPFKSILNDDIEVLCNFITETPKEIWGISDSGRTPLQLAYDKGSGILASVIVAKFPESISEIKWSYGDLIQTLIEEYSEESLCSGWNTNIECELWAIINNEYHFSEEDRLNWLPNCAKNSILQVAELGNVWAVWREDMENITHLPLEKWKGIYNEWKRS